MKQKGLMKLKVFTAAILLFSLLFPSMAFGAENGQSLDTDTIVQRGSDLLIEERRKEASRLKEQLGYGDDKLNDANRYGDREKVRVIIEVNEPKQLAKSTEQAKKQELKNMYDQVSQNILRAKSNSELRHYFFQGVHGFSMDVEYGHVKEIQQLKDVKEVHLAKTYKPALNASKDLIQAQETWEKYGLKGEGLLVAVVDSGIDYTHPDMVLSEEGKKEGKWEASTIQSVLDETEVDDIWYSDKVPSGYDWADMDNDVRPKRDTHGTHVAGIVGANGEVVGIAPEVQLLAEKVFSDNHGNAYEDDIIAGIEHAVELNADVINLSLGSDAGFVDEVHDPIQKAVREATAQGTLVIAAAGNAYHSAMNDVVETAQKPYASNPDIGIVGAPSVSPFALSVASYENDEIRYGTMKLSSGVQFPYADQTHVNFKLNQILDRDVTYELVYGHNGDDESLSNLNVEGKIVVIQPDADYASFHYAQFAANKKGAKAIVLVPTPSMKDFAALRLSEASTPVVTTSKEVGQNVIQQLEQGEEITFQLSDGVWLENPNKEEMSNFSSIGAPHTLDFKPEISAPGGNIYSTAMNGDYEVMDGTSMASPHVAGGAALVLQSLYQKGLEKSPDIALQTKLALMNTSQLVMQPNSDVPYSPRKQGAGLMQIQNAIETPILVKDQNAPLEAAGAVSLKEIKGNTVQFLLDVESLSDEKIEYDVYVDVLTDEIETLKLDPNEESRQYLSLQSERVEGAKVLVNGGLVTPNKGGKVLVQPNKNVKMYVNIFLPQNLKKNQFVEGYVRLVPKNKDASPEITVPYMGFYGEWDAQANVDPSPWEDAHFLGFTVLWDDMTDLPLGYDYETGKFDVDRIAISSRSVAPGIYSTFTAMRNLAKTEMYIENQDGEVIEQLGDFSEDTGVPWKFSKNLLPFGDHYFGGYPWEVANDDGNFIPDGDYLYTIKSVLDYKGARPQFQKMPIKVDSVGPTIEDIQVTPVDGQYKISFKAEDNENGSGFYGAVLYIDGVYTPIPAGEQSFIVDEEPKSVIVTVQDYAYNESFDVWGDASYIDQEILVSWFTAYNTDGVSIDNPLEIVGYGLSRMKWTVIIEDANGEEVDRFVEDRQHTLQAKWTPNEELAPGEYQVYAEVEEAGGFKVETVKVNFTIE